MLSSVQKLLPGSDRTGRLRLMGKYIGQRLVARPELDNTVWTESTSILKSSNRFNYFKPP